MTTKEYYDKKAVEMHYEDFMHWIDCYDYKLQPQKIIEWTDELVKKLTIPVVGSSNDVGVNLEFVGETYEIMEGVMFEKGTKSWLPTDEWEMIKHEMTDWKVI